MSDSEEDVEQSFPDFHDPSFVLVAVDTHPSMFVKMNNTGLSTFEICMRACYEVANSLLLVTNRRNWCPFAVVLANSGGTKDDDDELNSAIIDFNTNMIDVVKHLKLISQLNLNDLINNFQRHNEQFFDLGKFFRMCKKKLSTIKSNHEKILLYVTNDDNPVGIHENLNRFTAINEAMNFRPNGIKFDMVTMSVDFNYSIFFLELLSLSNQSGQILEQRIMDEAGMLDKLTGAIIIRNYQRALPFYIDINDKKRFLRITQKNYISSKKILNNHYTTTTGRPVKKITTSETDSKDYSLDYGMNKIDFDQSEYDDIRRTNLSIGYTLIYVGERVLPHGVVLNDPVVIEQDPKEDLPFFLNFWGYCIKNVAALICARKLRKNDKIRYFELIPKCINGKPAFLGKHIPFASEIEYPAGYPFTTHGLNALVSRIQYKAICDIFHSLRLNYNPGMFPSINYLKKENHIKSILLDEEEQEINCVVLDKPRIDERVLHFIDVFLAEYEMSKAQSSKRLPESVQNNDDDEGGPTKKIFAFNYYF